MAASLDALELKETKEKVTHDIEVKIDYYTSYTLHEAKNFNDILEKIKSCQVFSLKAFIHVFYDEPGFYNKLKNIFEIIGNHKTLREFSIMDLNYLKPNLILELAKAIAKNQSIKKLSLKGSMKIEKDNIFAVLVALMYHKNLEKLMIDTENFELEHYSMLAAVLEQNTRLKKLGVSYSIMPPLFNIIKNHKNLETLSFFRWKIWKHSGIEFPKEMVELFENPNLTSLHFKYLSTFWMSDSFFEALSRTKNLKSINLSSTRIGGSRSYHHLTDDEKITKFFNICLDLPYLTTLNLSKMGLTYLWDQEDLIYFKIIMDFIKNTKMVIELDLSENGFMKLPMDRYNLLKEALQQNTSLRRLILGEIIGSKTTVMDHNRFLNRKQELEEIVRKKQFEVKTLKEVKPFSPAFNAKKESYPLKATIEKNENEIGKDTDRDMEIDMQSSEKEPLLRRHVSKMTSLTS